MTKPEAPPTRRRAAAASMVDCGLVMSSNDEKWRRSVSVACQVTSSSSAMQVGARIDRICRPKTGGVSLRTVSGARVQRSLARVRGVSPRCEMEMAELKTHLIYTRTFLVGRRQLEAKLDHLEMCMHMRSPLPIALRLLYTACLAECFMFTVDPLLACAHIIAPTHKRTRVEPLDLSCTLTLSHHARLELPTRIRARTS